MACTGSSLRWSSLFLLDAARGVTSPALDSADFASDPSWSPDGTRVAHRVLRLPFGDDPGVPAHVVVGWDR